MTAMSYGNDIRTWRIDRTGCVMSCGRFEGTVDEVVAHAVKEHEPGRGYTTHVRDADGNTIVELYSNGAPQFGETVRDMYAVLLTVPRACGERPRYKVYKAL